MPSPLFALYAGPDQVMTVTSGLASVLGLLLIFWHKVVAVFFLFVCLFFRGTDPARPPVEKNFSGEKSGIRGPLFRGKNILLTLDRLLHRNQGSMLVRVV